MPRLITYGAVSLFASGFGISYWSYGVRSTCRAFPRLSGPAHFAVGFILASFWLHDTSYIVVGHDLSAIVLLEYTLHLP